MNSVFVLPLSHNKVVFSKLCLPHFKVSTVGICKVLYFIEGCHTRIDRPFPVNMICTLKLYQITVFKFISLRRMPEVTQISCISSLKLHAHVTYYWITQKYVGKLFNAGLKLRLSHWINALIIGIVLNRKKWSLFFCCKIMSSNTFALT